MVKYIIRHERPLGQNIVLRFVYMSPPLQNNEPSTGLVFIYGIHALFCPSEVSPGT